MEPPFAMASDRPLTASFDKLLKILGNLKSVYYHTITYHNIL